MKQESKKYHETKPGSIQDTVAKMYVNESSSAVVVPSMAIPVIDSSRLLLLFGIICNASRHGAKLLSSTASICGVPATTTPLLSTWAAVQL